MLWGSLGHSCLEKAPFVHVSLYIPRGDQPGPDSVLRLLQMGGPTSGILAERERGSVSWRDTHPVAKYVHVFFCQVIAADSLELQGMRFLSIPGICLANSRYSWQASNLAKYLPVLQTLYTQDEVESEALKRESFL